tara:strand:- start:666 stop:1220 length:555 start_codon:yes stop_codon:yes gene_type:complete
MKRLLLLLILILLVPAYALSTPFVIEDLERIKIKEDLSQAGKWKRTPTVVICQCSPVDKVQVAKAMAWWTERGYNFFPLVQPGDSKERKACNSSNPVGYILINLISQDVLKELDHDDLAVTHFYVDDATKEVTWAKIYLRTHIEERILEHELGHALGWMHTNQIRHLMHPKWMRGGWLDTGLEK